jgi:hypothetical protein
MSQQIYKLNFEHTLYQLRDCLYKLLNNYSSDLPDVYSAVIIPDNKPDLYTSGASDFLNGLSTTIVHK